MVFGFVLYLGQIPTVTTVRHRDNANPTAPATAIAPPTSECIVGCSPSNTNVNGITTIGVTAMIASTIPVGVVSKAHCMQLTPKVCPARLFTKTHGQIFRHFCFEGSMSIGALALARGLI